MYNMPRKLIISIILITEITPKNEFNNVPQRLARESQEIFI